MITDTFDNLSEEIIKVNRNDNAVKVRNPDAGRVVPF